MVVAPIRREGEGRGDEERDGGRRDKKRDQQPGQPATGRGGAPSAVYSCRPVH